MCNISIKLICRIIVISVLLAASSACSDHSKQDAAAVKAGIEAYTQGNYAAALEKFKPLADHGNADAQYNLGVMYVWGHGVPQDNKQAVELWTKAADGHSVNAQYNLGVMYHLGKGIPFDDKKAVTYWTMAAEQGNKLAQLSLGIMYAQGSGIDLDKVQAYKWFSIAADRGSQAAVQNLTTISIHMEPAQIEQGKGLARDWLASHANK